jgi:predicted RND superfamily exporter protein
LLIVGGGFLAVHQRVSSIYVDNLPPGTALDSIHTLEQKLSGVIRTVVYFEGEPGSMKRPDVLRAIAAVDKFAEKKGYVNTSVSLADLVAEENRAFNGGDPAAATIPKSSALIAQYLAILDPEDRADFVDGSYARSHIRILTADPGSETFRGLRAELEAEIGRDFAGLGVTTSLTGTAMVGYAALDRVVVEMLEGFAIGFAIIVLFVLVLFRSLRIALISVVPNLLTVIVTFVFMRVLDISLRMDTSLFMSVCVGGLFNTTIHLAARLRIAVAQGQTDRDLAIEETVRTVGPPSLYTAAILSLGFACFMLSGFPGLRAFGMLSLVTLVVAFFSDIIVSTALLRRFFGWPKPGATPARSLEAA